MAADDVEAILAAPRRLAVYRSLVRNGLAGVVVRMLPRTRARMNAACAGRFDADLAAFLEEVGPRTHYLRDVPGELFAWAQPRWAADAARAPRICRISRRTSSRASPSRRRRPGPEGRRPARSRWTAPSSSTIPRASCTTPGRSTSSRRTRRPRRSRPAARCSCSPTATPRTPCAGSSSARSPPRSSIACSTATRSRRRSRRPALSTTRRPRPSPRHRAAPRRPRASGACSSASEVTARRCVESVSLLRSGVTDDDWRSSPWIDVSCAPVGDGADSRELFEEGVERRDVLVALEDDRDGARARQAPARAAPAPDRGRARRACR